MLLQGHPDTILYMFIAHKQYISSYHVLIVSLSTSRAVVQLWYLVKLVRLSKKPTFRASRIFSQSLSQSQLASFSRSFIFWAQEHNQHIIAEQCIDDRLHQKPVGPMFDFGMRDTELFCGVFLDVYLNVMKSSTMETHCTRFKNITLSCSVNHRFETIKGPYNRKCKHTPWSIGQQHKFMHTILVCV